MDKQIVGVFRTEETAIRAINRLKNEGYKHSEISVLAHQKEESEKIADITDTKVEDRLSKDTGEGAFAGGVLGGIGTLLLELGVFAIPGVVPFLATGPIVSTLVGIIAGGAVGGTLGLLAELGFNKKESNEYKTYLDRGDILVLVDNKGISPFVNNNFYENESAIKDKYDL